MLERNEKYLEETTLIPALAGYEEKMAAYMRREFESCGLPVTIDTLGNCMARVDGTDPNAPVIMVFAHMDSLGFVVRYIEEDGFIRIERLGGIPEKVLPSTEIQIQTRSGEMIPGVIGRPPAGRKEDSGLPSGPGEAPKAAPRGEKGHLHGFFTPARLFFHRPDAMIEQRKNKKRPAGGMRFPWRRGVDRIWSG